jgi:hypothetical protein
MKLVIDRATWLRGEGSTNSYLLRLHDGKKCCVGFYALACGRPEKEIADIQTLHAQRADSWEAQRFEADQPVPDIYRLYFVNDHEIGRTWPLPSTDPSMVYPTTEAERERLIAETFAKHDVEVEFV